MMNIVVDAHHYTCIYVSLHKYFHVHVYLQTPYREKKKHGVFLRFEARPPRQPCDWHCGWSTQWGLERTGHPWHNGWVLWIFFAIIYPLVNIQKAIENGHL